MLNKIYIHYITTLFVLESFIISCWLLKGKKIGIGIGQFARKKSVSESATKNHDRCITSYKQFSQLFWTDCMCCLKARMKQQTTFSVILAEVFVLPIIEDISNLEF